MSEFPGYMDYHNQQAAAEREQELCMFCEAPAQPGAAKDQLPLCDYHNPEQATETVSQFLESVKPPLLCANCGRPATEGAYGSSCDEWPLCEEA